MGHQDAHSYNLLCARSALATAQSSDDWRLVAVIDWESAAVVDPRLAYSSEEPWASLRNCGHVVKGRWLAAAIVAAETSHNWLSLPRCDLGTLANEHDCATERLVHSGHL